MGKPQQNLFDFGVDEPRTSPVAARVTERSNTEVEQALLGGGPCDKTTEGAVPDGKPDTSPFPNVPDAVWAVWDENRRAIYAASGEKPTYQEMLVDVWKWYLAKGIVK